MTRGARSRAQPVGDASFVIALSCAIASACGGAASEMRERAEMDLRCRDDVELEERSPGRWRAAGCGRRVTYACSGGQCELRRRSRGSGERVDAGTLGYRSGVRETRGRRPGAWLIRGVIPARPGLEMEIVAATRRPARVMVIVRNQGRARFHWCETFEVSIDGTAFTIPRAEREVDGDGADAVETLRGTTPISMVERLAEGREVRGRLCTMQFEFREGAASIARDLLTRLRARIR